MVVALEGVSGKDGGAGGAVVTASGAALGLTQGGTPPKGRCFGGSGARAADHGGNGVLAQADSSAAATSAAATGQPVWRWVDTSVEAAGALKYEGRVMV